MSEANPMTEKPPLSKVAYIVDNQNTQGVDLVACSGFSYEYIDKGDIRIRVSGNIASVHATDEEISIGFRIPIEEPYAILAQSASVKSLVYISEQDERGFKLRLIDDSPNKIRFEKYIGAALSRIGLEEKDIINWVNDNHDE
jgi:hypothetical protein